MKRFIACSVFLAALSSVPATAQTGSLTPIYDEAGANIGVTFGVIKYTAFHSNWGIEGTYETKPLTKPFTSLGFRAGAAATVGIHDFGDGDRLKLFQGGLHLVADRIGTPKFQMYGNFMIGPGNYYGSTDMFLTLVAGANIPLQDKKYLIRVEAAQTNDFYDGGREGGWRFSGGLTIPLK